MRTSWKILPLFILVAALARALASSPQAQSSTVSTGGIITGRIEAERSGSRSPLRRARVVLRREGTQESAATLTDGDARYRFDRLAPGRYIVTAEKPGFATGASAPFDIAAGSSRTVDVVLNAGSVIQGRLRDDRNRAIVETVTADQLTEQGAVVSSYTASTDDLGRFRIHSLPEGRYRLRMSLPLPATGALYYPATTDASSARLIVVAAGMTSDALEFTVPVPPASTAVNEAATPASTSAAPDPKTARITGTVSRSDSGLPIPNATVQLVDGSGVFRYRVTTGLDGHYELPGVPAASWALSVVAPGFTAVDATVTRPGGAGVRLTLKEGQDVQQDVALAPVSAIEGQVLDEFGDPAPGVVVQVAQKGAAVGLSRFLSSSSLATTGTTDDRGWFRAPRLFPGDYYLIAVPQPFDKSWMPGFAPTFFPGTTQADAAAPISVVAGRDVYDARFAIAAARTANVTGQVVDAGGQPVPKVQVMLLPVEDGEVRAMLMARVLVETGGAFVFDGVPDGTYVVQAFGAGAFGVGSLTIDAARSRQAGIKLIAKPLTTARGRVVFDGDAPVPPRSQPRLSISFQPMSFTTGPVGSNRIEVVMHPDWSFEIPNLAWYGVLRVSPPPGWGLAAIRHEGRTITDTPFDFQSADVSGLEVVLTSRTGTVSGTVTSGGQPAANAKVLVFGAEDTSWAYLTRTMTTRVTDGRGNFTVSELVPGRYLAASTSDDLRLADHTRLLAVRSSGVPFTITAGATTAVTLTAGR